MDEPRRTSPIRPLLAVGLLTTAAVFAGAVLVAEPEPPARLPDVAPRIAPTENGIRHVLWDEAAARVAEALPDVPVTPGEEFHVVCEFGDEAVAAAVREASRQALPMTLALLGGETSPQRRPYEVLVVRTKQRLFEEAERLQWRPPSGVRGFAELASGRNFVTSDDLDDGADVLALAGPGTTLTFVAAHEAAHQVAARCLPGAGSGADWLCEGLAQVVGERVVAEILPGTDLGEVPLFSGMMLRCQGLLAADRLPTAAAMFSGEFGWVDGGTKYALVWAFFRTLDDAPQRERTQAMLAEIRRLPRSPDIDGQIRGIARRIWGAEGMAELTTAFRRHVEGFAPKWRSTGRRLEVRGTTWTQVDASVAEAGAHRASPAGRAGYCIRGAVEILPRGDRIADVSLGEREGDVVYVSFQAERGVGLYVPDRKRRDDPNPPLAYGSDVRPATGRRTAFEIHVRKDKIVVLVDGFTALEWDPAGRDMSGAWGVGCSRFRGSRERDPSAAVWHDVRLE